MDVVVTFQDIINQISDLNQNYTVSTLDLGNIQRAANRAIEFVQRRLGLPSDKKIFSFYFYQDTPFYTLPSGFNEIIQLYYNTTNGSVSSDTNTLYNRWLIVEDTEILRSSSNYGGQFQNRIAFTTMNGSNQIIMNGRNLRGQMPINSFNTTTGLTFSVSITGATVDNNIFKEGGASIIFNVANTESASTISWKGTWDIRQWLNAVAALRIWLFFPTGIGTNDFTNIELRLISSTGNYYTMNTTVDYLGNAWASNGWSLLSFALNNVTTVGSPVASGITSIEIVLNHAGGFTSVSNMRIDYLYLIQPDLMDLVFYSAFKGTDSTGDTQKILLDTSSDILAFGSLAPDLIYPISLKAALILWPQLRADPTFMASYKADFIEAMTLYGKSYPRKRSLPAASHQLIR